VEAVVACGVVVIKKVIQLQTLLNVIGPVRNSNP